MNWEPSLGATRTREGAAFRVWAPEARTIHVRIESGRVSGSQTLQRGEGGYFTGAVEGVRAGDRYRYRVDGEGPYPDPASRFQPLGVHGPSEIVDPGAFRWNDQEWAGVDLDRTVFYELHTGTFSPEGTFAGAIKKLPYLRELGVTAVELMPVADFPGKHNWGYDGVALFAPARCYGTPDDLRRLVAEAHGLGLAVYLDVVYNHFGPDGSYAGAFSRRYFSRRHRSPWGAGINLDGPQGGEVRRFFIENALHWIHEYHFDGLRLDATHALVDDSPRHFLAELSGVVRSSMEGTGRKVHLIAEDHRNLAHMAKPESEGGWGLDAVWADDLHHQIRRRLAGDTDGYFQDFEGKSEDIAATLRRGWFFCGQHSKNFGEPRGTDTSGLDPKRFVVCIQNHDQVGNRAFGDRLHHTIEPAEYRAAVTLLLTAPETPLLFMGQEWAASSPFQFFTDHHAELGRKVTQGRRREFQRFQAFSDPKTRERIPDPQAADTIARSRLPWGELEREPHASVLRLYRRLLRLRQEEPAFAAQRGSNLAIGAADDDTIWIRLGRASDPPLLAVIRLGRAGLVDLSAAFARDTESGQAWELLISTEEPAYAQDPLPLILHSDLGTAEFQRAGGLVFRLRK